MQADEQATQIASLVSARDEAAARAGQLDASLAAEADAHSETRAALAAAQSMVRRMAPLCICMQPSPVHPVGTTSCCVLCHAVLLGSPAFLLSCSAAAA